MSKEYDDYLKKHVSAVKHLYKLLTGDTLIVHDMTKWSKIQYEPYDQKWYKNNKTPDYDLAVLDHYHREPHHWNYWVKFDEDEMTPLDIPDRFINEMIADWASFSYNSGKPEEIIHWYNDHKKNILLSDKTKKKVEELIPKVVSLMKEEFGMN